jgi:hypothetical protein
MNEVAGGLPSVVRPGLTWRLNAFTAMIGFLAIGALMIAIGEWYLAPFCLYGSGGGFRYATCRVDLYERHIVVHNSIRTVRLDWADIEGFDAVQSLSAGFAYVVRANTPAGSIVPMHGTTRWRRDVDQLCTMFESRLG